MAIFSYDNAQLLLSDLFNSAEEAHLTGTPTAVSYPAGLTAACNIIFTSQTLAFREVLLGCVLAHIVAPDVNIRHPYVNLGSDAFNGRTLDERVVNPFLQSRRVPCTKGPYLSVFRRSVPFTPATRDGLRDKAAYDAFLTAILYVEESDTENAKSFLFYLLSKFIVLREANNITLSRLHRISLDQFRQLFDRLLSTPSGGLFPMLTAVAMFQTIRDFYKAGWDVTWQGINVADAARGVGGDITVTSGDHLLLAVEVTERQVDQSRVVTTFNTKISRLGIEDYLFLVRPGSVDVDARQQAAQYFAQGHEINFVNIADWMLMSLATMGFHGRVDFSINLLTLLDQDQVSTSLKVAWNESIAALLAP